METATFGAPYGAQEDADIKGVLVKQETKDFITDLAHVKKEALTEDATAEEPTTGRSTRKRKLNSMAETSDFSDESGDENYTKPQPKKRGSGASASRSRGRPKKAAGDVPANMADPSRNPRIVLKNIASEDAQSGATGGDIKVNLDSPPAKTPRAKRAVRTPAAKTPAKPASKKKTKEVKVEPEEEEEEPEEEDGEEDNGDVDFEEDLDDDDDDEDFVPKKGKSGRAAKQPARARGKGKGKGGKVKQESENEEEEDEEGEEDDEGAGPDAAAGENTETNPNAVKTGQYLIDKLDMRRLENYPIWRMEGPNMLRKFEMIVQDGSVRHKSLYAYASWAQSMQDLFEKISVRQISSQDGETVVEIEPDCVPQPPELSSLESKYLSDELLPLYRTYIEALFRQAVDSNFLKNIKADADSPYLDAINRIDAIIKDKIASIENEVSMKDEFKTRVRNCPNMKSIRRQNWTQTDQATTNKSAEKGVRSVLMFGYGYDPFLMEEDKSKGVEVAQEVVIGSTMDQYLVAYHGLIHFKYALLRRCQDKVKLTNAMQPGGDVSVLDKCLQDRCWILRTFEDLKNLLANQSPS